MLTVIRELTGTSTDAQTADIAGVVPL